MTRTTESIQHHPGDSRPPARRCGRLVAALALTAVLGCSEKPTPTDPPPAVAPAIKRSSLTNQEVPVTA
ncbi:MAG: hypothetical protein B7Z55_06235, partial [Planctomycetales bacterium 12-60-4]